MAKKFFYDKVHNTKRKIINFVIIGACIIGVIICFLIVSHFQGQSFQEEPSAKLSIKEEVTVEVNEEFEKNIFFSEIDGVNLDDIKITYDLNYDISKIGTYTVNIFVNDKTYSTKINVVDTTKPVLTLKNVTIKSGEEYYLNNFIESCTDNSKEPCAYEYYKSGTDVDGNLIDYTTYKEDGTYSIKVVAKDSAGNQAIEEATLTIGGGEEEPPIVDPEPTDCKYGNNVYDTENYLIAIDITNNSCAISLDLYKDETVTAEINQLMEAETTKIKKDIEALNLSGTLTLNRKVTAVINTSGDGIVGYQLQMTVNITKDDQTEVVADYKVDKDGNRVYIVNPYSINA